MKSFRKIGIKTFSSSNSMYDLVVVGGGPAGYIASIKAGQKKLKVACVEKRETLGGTCLNVGCIPSKSLLNTSLKYYEAKHQFTKLGLTADNVTFDLQKVMNHKSQVVGSLCKGIEGLFKKNTVDFISGAGRFKDRNTLIVKKFDGSETEIKSKNFLIATGSEPNNLPGGILPINEKNIVSSTGALSLTKLPKNMIVIGAGVIGLELGSVYNRFGSEVTVVEYADKILPPFDNEISTKFQTILKRQKFNFMLSHKVVGGKILNDGTVSVQIENLKDKKITEISSDVVLVSTGRKPFTSGLNLEVLEIRLDKMGRIPVDKNLMTTTKGIYAVGDVIEGPMLAHKGEEEGVAVVEHICGEYSHINYGNIPNVVYTHPEIASIGFTEEELKAKSKNHLNLK